MSAGIARTGRRRPPAASTARVLGEMGRLADLALAATQVVYLAVLWLIACLPVVTIPAASVALVARVRAWRTCGQEPSARAFVREVRTAFVRRSATMTAVVIAAVVLALDLRAITLAPETIRPAALVLWFAVAIAVAMLTVLVPAVLATRDVGCVAALRCAARAAVLAPRLALAAALIVTVAVVVVISVPLAAPLLAVATASSIDRLSARADLSLSHERTDAS